MFNNDSLSKSEIYEYNEYGDDAMIVLIFPDRTDNYTYEYIYDELGNWIEKIEYLNGAPYYRYVQEITYID